MRLAARTRRRVRNGHKIVGAKREGKGELWSPKCGHVDDIKSGF